MLSIIPLFAHSRGTAVVLDELQALRGVEREFCVAADERDVFGDRLRDYHQVGRVGVIPSGGEVEKSFKMRFGNVTDFDAKIIQRSLDVGVGLPSLYLDSPAFHERGNLTERFGTDDERVLKILENRPYFGIQFVGAVLDEQEYVRVNEIAHKISVTSKPPAYRLS